MISLSPILWERVAGLSALAVLTIGGVALLVVYVDELIQWVKTW